MTLTELVRQERPEQPRFRPEQCIREAVAIGERMAAEAYVHGDRCNWLTRNIVYARGFEPKDRPTVRPLGPNMYDGTAGVAVLLARLVNLAGADHLAERARQALNHSLRHDWSQEDPLRRFGFYSGLTGTAWAAHELAWRLDRPALLGERDRVLRHLRGRDIHEGFQDMIFGAAGAIPALCRMHQDDPGAETALRLADGLAKRLVDTAEWDGDAASWDGARTHGRHTPNLTGFSHGTSGIAWGLAHYAAYRSDADAQEAAVGALRYEASWFVEDAQDWRDLRNDFAPDRPLPTKFASVWCHGAPGIGLGRLGFTGLGDVDHPLLDDLRAAADRTRDSLARWWLNPGGDISACHGIAGNAEALSLMEHALGEDGTRTMQEWAAWLVRRYGVAHDVDWPTAVSTGQHPSLMTGVGSAAHFLLRACDESLLDPLVLPPHPVGS